jgi:hypothetical protein
VKQETVRVNGGFSYVLVIQWLDEKSEPTGEQLYTYLQEIGFDAGFIDCKSANDVRNALAMALEIVRTRGYVPIIHLEAHGSDPWKEVAEDLGFGPGDGADSVKWSTLGEWMGPLNVATDLQLMMVSAACFGSAAMAGISAAECAAPFAFAVGFRTRVTEGRLRDAMREFYRAVKRGDPLEECVASSQRELDAGQLLKLEKSLDIVVRMIRTVLYGPDAPPRASLTASEMQKVRAMWDVWFPPAAQEHNPAYKFVGERFVR